MNCFFDVELFLSSSLTFISEVNSAGPFTMLANDFHFYSTVVLASSGGMMGASIMRYCIMVRTVVIGNGRGSKLIMADCD